MHVINNVTIVSAWFQRLAIVTITVSVKVWSVLAQTPEVVPQVGEDLDLVVVTYFVFNILLLPMFRSQL